MDFMIYKICNMYYDVPSNSNIKKLPEIVVWNNSEHDLRLQLNFKDLSAQELRDLRT